MKGTIQIARFANIPVLLHWSFGLVLLYVMYAAMTETGDWLSMLWILGIVLTIFVCVVLHEYGHALMARQFGVRTRDIILSPIGGVARLEYLPEKPSQELWIALAGPFVNIVIALLLSPYFLLVADSWQVCTDIVSLFLESFNVISERSYQDNDTLLTPIHSLGHFFVPVVIGMNLILAIFNMLPAFPMDGGRVLRALFSFQLSRLRATMIATLLGWISAIFFIYKGINDPNPVLIVIGIFVFFAAYQEYQMVRRDTVLNSYKVRDIIRTDFTKIPTSETMQSVIDTYKRGQEDSFVVVDLLDRIVGVLPESVIKKATKQSSFDLVEQYQQVRFETISPNESLKWLFHKMQTRGYYILPVYESGEIIGVVDRKGFSDFLIEKRKLF